MLAQLGTRIQHALRAYTPNEQKALEIASRSFRANTAFDTAQAIQNLGVGEALVSTLDEKGAPTMVAKTKIRPPSGRMGPATEAERAALLAASPVQAAYATEINRESAYELLSKRAETDTKTAEEAAAAQAAEKAKEQAEKEAERRAREAEREARARERAAPRRRASSRQTVLEATMKSMARQAGTQITREIMRGILGGLKRR